MPFGNPGAYSSWMYPEGLPGMGFAPNPVPTQMPTQVPSGGAAPIDPRTMQAILSLGGGGGGGRMPGMVSAPSPSNMTRQVQMAPQPGGMSPQQKLTTLAAILSGRV